MRDGSVLNQESNRGERSGQIKKIASMALGDRLDLGMQGTKNGISLGS